MFQKPITAFFAPLLLGVGACSSQPNRTTVAETPSQAAGPSPAIFVRVSGPKAKKQGLIEFRTNEQATPTLIPDPFGCPPELVESVRKAAAAVYAGQAKVARTVHEADLEVHIQYRPYADMNYGQYKPDLEYRLQVIDVKNQVIVGERRLGYQGRSNEEMNSGESDRKSMVATGTHGAPPADHASVPRTRLAPPGVADWQETAGNGSRSDGKREGGNQRKTPENTGFSGVSDQRGRRDSNPQPPDRQD